MKLGRFKYLHLISIICFFSCQGTNDEKIKDIATIATGWRGEIVAKVDQSYVGWDVEISDADNDGQNE